jgi:hypothetical protein
MGHYRLLSDPFHIVILSHSTDLLSETTQPNAMEMGRLKTIRHLYLLINSIIRKRDK